MAANKLQWRRIAKGDKLPCQSFLRKKNGEILKFSTEAGVTVGQDAYYLPVDDVIEEIKNYPIEESKGERIRKHLIGVVELYYGNTDEQEKKDCLAWLEKQGGQKPAWSEEDEEIHRKCICAMRASACGFPEEEKFVEQVDNWLKDLKERVLPQKQGEKKLYVNDNAKEMFIKALERVEEQNAKGYKLTDCDKNSWWEDFKAYTSCIIEQKPADKVEPKFKVGDIVKHKDNPHLTYILKRFTDDGDYEFHAIGKDGHEGCTCFSVVKYQDEWELVEQKTVEN